MPTPESTRNYASLLVHEFLHASKNITAGLKGAKKVYTRLLELAKSSMSKADIKAIEDKYKVAYGNKQQLIDEEIIAEYGETFAGEQFISSLLSDEPTLFEKLLAHFRGASKDYAADPRLSREARKFYKLYKKMFDNLAAVKQNTNAVEGANALTNINSEKMHFIGGDVNEKLSISKDTKETVTNADRTFSYDELIAKDDLVGFTIKTGTQVPLNSDGSIDGKKIVTEVRKQCKTLQTKSSSPTYFINVPDIGRNVEIVEKSITHGFFDGTKKNKKPSTRDLLNAKVSLAMPEILKNSIEVNHSERKGNLDIPYAHIMMGTVGIINNIGLTEYYAVRSVVEERINLDPLLVEAEILGKLHAINAKKVDSPNLKVAKKSVARGHGGAYTYSIADFLNDVKSEFADTFS